MSGIPRHPLPRPARLSASFLAQALCAALLLSAPPARAATTLQMTTEYPATSMPGLGVTTFAEQVKEKSHGNIVIEASFDAAKGYKSADMVDAVQARKVDAADAFAGGLANKYPIFGVSSLPFLADSLDKARALRDAARPVYERFLASHGQKLLYTTPWPPSGIWSKTPIKTVGDLQALSIRTYDEVSQATMTRAGAKAFNISFADAMPRLASGEVNAVLSSGDGGAGRKLWQYLPCFIEVNYAMPLSIATMNLAAYHALDAAGRKAIDEAAAATEAEQWKRMEGRLEENRANMRKNGVTIESAVPPAVQQALHDAAANALSDWETRTGADGKAILDQYKAKTGR
ncbi:TRAP transporter substrate-binding protein [Bordetella bronchialis]|uniref:TRAP transporter substrate-binding protein n=1 Tax=Bordetella bronchialis TaxID=463025 RepID=UPI0009F1999E|nr:TRAP transporter substrate-binding protein [Bordetella bronchialis]